MTPPHSNQSDNSMGDLSCSPDGKILSAQLDYPSSFNLFDAHTLKKIDNISLPNVADTQEEGTFSSNSQIFAFHGGLFIHLYDLRSHRVKRKLRVGVGSIRSIAWSPDNKLLAVGEYTGEITLWNPSTGKRLQTWQGARGYSIDFLEFSPDSRVLASALSYPFQITLRRVQ